jgi:hypothetical protein
MVPGLSHVLISDDPALVARLMLDFLNTTHGAPVAALMIRRRWDRDSLAPGSEGYASSTRLHSEARGRHGGHP